MKLIPCAGRPDRPIVGGAGGKIRAANIVATIRAALVFGAALALCGQGAWAQNQSFRTTTGHELSLPPVSSLDCAELDQVLRKIDAANYRSIGSQRPSNPDDGALYDYEDAASARLARFCGGVTKSQSFGRARSGSKWDFGR